MLYPRLFSLQPFLDGNLTLISTIESCYYFIISNNFSWIHWFSVIIQGIIWDKISHVCIFWYEFWLTRLVWGVAFSNWHVLSPDISSRRAVLTSLVSGLCYGFGGCVLLQGGPQCWLSVFWRRTPRGPGSAATSPLFPPPSPSWLVLVCQPYLLFFCLFVVLSNHWQISLTRTPLCVIRVLMFSITYCLFVKMCMALEMAIISIFCFDHRIHIAILGLLY